MFGKKKSLMLVIMSNIREIMISELTCMYTEDGKLVICVFYYPAPQRLLETTGIVKPTLE